MISAKETIMLLTGIGLAVGLYVLKTSPNLFQHADGVNTDGGAMALQNPPEIKVPYRIDPEVESSFEQANVPTWEFNFTPTQEITAAQLAEWQTLAEQAMQEERYFLPESDNALAYLLKIRNATPENVQAASQLQQLTSALLVQANVAVEENNIELLTQLIGRLKAIDPKHQNIAHLTTELSQLREIEKLSESVTQYIADQNIVSLDQQDAWHTVRKAQNIAPDNRRVVAMEDQVISILSNESVRAAEEQDFTLANSQLHLAEELKSTHPLIAQTQQRIAQLKQRRFTWLDEQFHIALRNRNTPRAELLLTELDHLSIDATQLNEYRDSLLQTTTYAGHAPFDAIQDSFINDPLITAPTLVVMPTGAFEMGRDGGRSYEQPQHTVQINYGFAVSKYEITHAEFAEFIEQTDYETSAERLSNGQIYDARTGRLKNKRSIDWRNDYLGKRSSGDSPVIHVSWNDARAYTQWLSAMTGHDYRLLSESEFEYILSAGSQYTYPWGNAEPTTVLGNFTGQDDRLRNSRVRWRDGFASYNDGHWGPAPVGSFIPNLFGLHDLSGNVMEWTEDCWHDSYTRAPDDGSAWVNPGCENHVIRGGSWSSAKFEYETQHRYRGTSDYTDPRLGFRVARNL